MAQSSLDNVSIIGATGATGAPGLDGLDGTPGITGATGVAGLDGLDGAPGASPAMQLITDILLGADAANFDFTSIPGTYKHLELVMDLRGTTSATFVQPQLTFNNDSTSGHYDYEKHYASATSPAAGGVINDAFIGLPDACAATSASGSSSGLQLKVPNYAGTTFHKNTVCQGWNPRTEGTLSAEFIMNAGGTWKSTAAITRITITPAAGNWLAGSRVSLYGIN